MADDAGDDRSLFFWHFLDTHDGSWRSFQDDSKNKCDLLLSTRLSSHDCWGDTTHMLLPDRHCPKDIWEIIMPQRIRVLMQWCRHEYPRIRVMIYSTAMSESNK